MDMVKGIRALKSDFRKNYTARGHLREVIPTAGSELIPIPDHHINMLHKFAEHNPIYVKSQDAAFAGSRCRVYTADINHYWLDSIKHDASYQSFYPTWMLSAYALSATLNELGFTEAVDIGSGDGRIAYCAHMAGMAAHGIEIDHNLAELQRCISADTGVLFDVVHADATKFDYATLELERPAFFVSGLPEMGGEMLADGVAGMLPESLKRDAILVLMGKSDHTIDDGFGWDMVIRKFELRIDQIVHLPTHWTAEQEDDTPHVFVSFSV